MERLLRAVYLGTVFCTGAGVLVVEVIAVRLLAPYFGASMYVLSSVLTVILLALALGYYAGGKISDRYPQHLPLYSIITASGLSLLALTFLAQVILPTLGYAAPLMLGPLFFALLLFFLPAFLLGVDSPYVIRLLTDFMPDHLRGEVVGATFFWSTAGSITGSLLAGFVLVPLLGLTTSLVGTGVLLVALGIGGGTLVTHLHRRLGHTASAHPRNLTTPILAALLGSIALAYANVTHSYTDRDYLYLDDGYYSRIAVYERPFAGEDVRFLQRDNNFSSGVFVDRPGLVFAYTQYALLYDQLFADQPEDFLMLGGGAYTIPTALHAALPDLSIDVVEIEPQLHDLAQEYFRLPESDRIENHVMDARAYLSRTEEEYDFVFVDTFTSGLFIPPHLVTIEYLRELREHLTDDGVVMVNFIGSRPRVGEEERTVTGSFTKTFTEVFPEPVVYTSHPERPQALQNLVFIARKNGGSIDLDPETVITQQELDLPLRRLAITPERLMRPADAIFTDDHSPVELLLVNERVW